MATRLEPARAAPRVPDSNGSPQDHLAVQQFAVADGLKPFVTTLYSLTCGEPQARDVLPAGVGYLLFFISGAGQIRFASGQEQQSSPVTLLGPTSAAATVDLTGPLRVVGAALSPLGWAALTGLDAARHRDSVADAALAIGPGIAHFAGTLDAAESDEIIAQRIAGFIAAHLRPVNPRHIRLLRDVLEWLSSDYNPPIEALQARAAYSPRQLQRLIERYFGTTPKQLVRKYRALRVAALLQDPASSDERVAAALDQFYDQSHAIREIRHFMGRTPARLGDGSAPLLEAASALSNYYELTPNVARMPGD